MNDPSEEQSKRTTVNVSPEFAEAVTALARDADKTVAEFCDEQLLPKLRDRYVQILRRKLKNIAATA